MRPAAIRPNTSTSRRVSPSGSAGPGDRARADAISLRNASARVNHPRMSSSRNAPNAATASASARVKSAVRPRLIAYDASSKSTIALNGLAPCSSSTRRDSPNLRAASVSSPRSEHRWASERCASTQGARKSGAMISSRSFRSSSGRCSPTR